MLLSGISEALNFRELDVNRLIIDLLTLFIFLMIVINVIRITTSESVSKK